MENGNEVPIRETKAERIKRHVDYFNQHLNDGGPLETTLPEGFEVITSPRGLLVRRIGDYYMR